MSVALFKSQGETQTETFSVWVPAVPSLVKAEGASGRTDELVRWVQGLTSTGNRDQQKETMLQNGIDFDPLLTKGSINWNHQPGPANLIGVPTEAALRETQKGFGLWMRGYLYPEKPVAQDAWDHLQAVEKSRAAGLPFRPVGWSVEGGIVERDPFDQSIIRKSVVRHMALTHEPVNADTYAELVRSFGHEWSGEQAFSPEHNTHYAYSDFGAFAKSFGAGPGAGVANTFAASPLDLQNLDGGAVSVLADKVLGRRCRGKCRKREADGTARKALRHMVDCCGFDLDSSTQLVKALVETLGS